MGLVMASTIAAAPVLGVACEAAVPTVMEHARSTDALDATAGSRGFIENVGQLQGNGISFYWDSPGLGIAFLDSALLMDAKAQSPSQDDRTEFGTTGSVPISRDGHPSPPEGRADCVVRLDFVGSERVTPESMGAIPGRYNFIRGNDPARWRTGVRAFSEVVYRGLYPGIDLVYRASPDGVKYEFLVGPGADPSRIVVHAEGQSSLRGDGGTALVIDTVAGRLFDDGLVAHYAGDPSSHIECRFRLVSSDSYTFDLGARDPARALVIDPLMYSTYLNGFNNDCIVSVRLGSSDGAMFMGGWTRSPDFPTSAGVYQDRLGGEGDAFVTKLSADGSALVYSTFIGGSMWDGGEGLDLDSGGNVFLVGVTQSTNFPVSADAVKTTFDEGTNGTDGFACKLGPKGDSLVYSTYVGGSGWDRALAVDADMQGCAYITGTTTSSDLDVTDGAFQRTAPGGENDAFVCKLDADGTQYIYSTYLGGEDIENPGGIVVDSEGCAHVTGDTASALFPVTKGAFSTTNNGWADAFVTKLTADGSGLAWSTYLGGMDYESAAEIALDADGRPVVVGYTTSRDFPTTAGAFQTKLAGSSDDFITDLATDGTRLIASTFLGGGSDELARGVWIGPDREVLTCGYTLSDDFPKSTDALQKARDGGADATVSSLSGDLGTLTYSTYLGGDDYDEANGIVVDGNHSVCVGGSTYSTDFPVTADAYQPSDGAALDGFLCKLIIDSLPPIAVAGDDVTIDQHQTVELNGSRSSDNLGVVNWTWTFRYNGSDVALAGPVRSFLFDAAGMYAITLTVTDVARLRATDVVNVTVRDITRPVANAGNDRFIDQHERVDLDGAMSSDNVGISNYTWTFAYGGETVTLWGSGPSFTFDDAGTYSIELNVSDAMGNWARDSLTVIVKDITAPTPDAGPDAVVSQHAQIALDGSASRDNVGIVNYSWSFVYAGQPVTLYGPAASFVFDLAGSYTVTLTVSDGMGNVGSDAMTVEVLDTTPPTADAGPDATILQGQTARFDGSGSRDNVAVGSWTWRFDYGGTPTALEGHDPQFVFELAGTFTVTLTVTDDAGNSAEDAITVTVKDLEAPVAEAGADIQIGQHQLVTFDGALSADNLGIVNWTWTFDRYGSQVALHGSSASFMLDEAGTCEVTLVVVDAAGNHASDKVTVTVKDTTPPKADAGLALMIEQGSTLTLDGSRSTDNVAVTSWTWTFTYDGAPVRLLGRTQSFTFERPAMYNVTLTVEDAEGLSDATAITVKVRDNVDPTVVAPGHLTAKTGDRITLDGSGSTDNVGIVRWEWTFRDGGRDVKLNGSTVGYAFKDEGDHTVTLTTYDAEGNAAAQTFTVTVEGGSALLYVAVLAVVLVLVAVALVVTRRRGPKAS